MKRLVFICAVSASILGAGCHKSNDNKTTTVTETQVLNDFVNKIALPNYANLQAKATALNTAIVALNANPTNDNLSAARQAWRDVRASWEGCEGFLLGPVEDNNYDPNTDTWPVDYHQLDSMISSSSSFSIGVVQNLVQSLRGYHPLEFILWGQTGNATSDSLTTSQKQYMVALSQDILNNIDSLNQNWATNGGNFQQQILQAGSGSTRYTSRQQAFLAIVAAMSDICNEVGQQSAGGKIFDPYASRDTFQTESPFSHNSMTDFKSNIIGAQNVYLCTFNGSTGASLSSFVAQKNISLDNSIKAQFQAAINALNNVSGTFEYAVWNERTQLLAAMTALNTLQATLDGDLKTHIQTYVKD